jgi:multidrug transporter EmrE-like cation transporter
VSAGAAWGILALAVAFEVVGTSMLKLADGFARPLWFVAALLAYGVCFAFLTIAFKHIPLSVAYLIWGAGGAVLIVLADIFLFGQAIGGLKLMFMAVIIVGVIGLKLAP